MAAQLYKTSTGRMFHAGEIAIVTVGLPGRGKTFLAHKLSRYLRWLGVPTSIFSVGDYRRKYIGTKMPPDFFSDPTTLHLRMRVADQALEDLIAYCREGGQVGIYDASNTEPTRRQFIYKRLKEAGIQVLFIESICDREDIIEANILEHKGSSPDYVGFESKKMVIDDFKKRIDGYISTYERLKGEEQLPFIQVMNVTERMVVNEVKGYLQSRIVFYLMNLRTSARRIYLCRNGETVNEMVLRSDAPLSPRGELFSILLPQRLSQLRQSQGITTPLRVWTSPRQRSYGSASRFPNYYRATPFCILQKSGLVEMNLGAVDGLSQDQLREKYREEYETHMKDSYHHRYPRAESYHDLALRLEDILLDVEREKDDVLIIAHATVLRCIYAYLLDRPETEIPSLPIPEETIIELKSVAYGCNEQRYHLTKDTELI